MTRTTIEVTQDPRGWRIDRDGDAVISFDVAGEAVAQAAQLARDNSPSVLVVRADDGHETDRTVYDLGATAADAA